MHSQSSVIRQRGDLKYLENTEVECSGRIKQFKKHEKRRDLDSWCLTNVIVTPTPVGESIYLDHIWILRKQLKKAGCSPVHNQRIHFVAKVYSYKRLGGKSIDRGLYGLEDYGLLPLHMKDNCNEG